MSYSLEITLTSLVSGALWESANHANETSFRIILRAIAFMLAAICAGYLVLQHASLTLT